MGKVETLFELIIALIVVVFVLYPATSQAQHAVSQGTPYSGAIEFLIDEPALDITLAIIGAIAVIVVDMLESGGIG